MVKKKCRMKGRINKLVRSGSILCHMHKCRVPIDDLGNGEMACVYPSCVFSFALKAAGLNTSCFKR